MRKPPARGRGSPHPGARRSGVSSWLAGVLLLSAGLPLVACGAPPAPPITVAGRVVSIFDLPAPGVTVHVQGKTVVTDAEGRFTLAGITTPYDLLLGQASGDGWWHLIEGLTETEPRLGARWAAIDQGFAAEVDVTLTGGPIGPGRTGFPCFEGLDAPAVALMPGFLGEGADAFGLTLAALGQGSVAARLHLLEASLSGEGVPLAYHGHAVAEATLREGVPTAIAVPPLAPVGSTVASATLVPPGGGQLVLVQLGIELGPLANLTVYQRLNLLPGDPLAGTISMPLPLVGSGFRLMGGAQVGGGVGLAWRVRDGPVLGTLALPVPPQLLLPADGVAEVTAATPFSAVHDAAGPVTFVWEPLAAGPRLARTTSRREVTMPDAAAVGLTLPPAAAYRWTVESHGPVDLAAATRGSPEALRLSLSVHCAPGLTGDGELAQSGRRELTLAP